MEVSGASSVVEDGLTSPLRTTDFPLSPGDVGLLKSTILPSFALHSSLSVASYLLSRFANRAEIKDYFWPSTQVLNAWWSSVGRACYYGNIPLRTAWAALSWTEKLLLSGVTIWGTRLFYRIVSRSVARGARDDPRYEHAKATEYGFWKTALWKLYLPEAVFQTIISLPFTVPFRMVHADGATMDQGFKETLNAVAVVLFSAGFALEVMADAQLEMHRQERTDLCRHGVWSIVRHPNYLGDTLVHLSFAVLNAAGAFHPVVLLGPLANYIFLHCVGGDKQNEASQEERYKAYDPHKYEQLQTWRREKNGFWPGLRELANPWTWVVLGSGLVGVVVEEAARGYFTSQ